VRCLGRLRLDRPEYRNDFRCAKILDPGNRVPILEPDRLALACPEGEREPDELGFRRTQRTVPSPVTQSADLFAVLLPATPPDRRVEQDQRRWKETRAYCSTDMTTTSGLRCAPTNAANGSATWCVRVWI
jgi:hypothetical protein